MLLRLDPQRCINQVLGNGILIAALGRRREKHQVIRGYLLHPRPARDTGLPLMERKEGEEGKGEEGKGPE